MNSWLLCSNCSLVWISTSEGKSKMALGAWYMYQALSHSYCYYLLLKIKLLVQYSWQISKVGIIVTCNL